MTPRKVEAPKPRTYTVTAPTEAAAFRKAVALDARKGNDHRGGKVQARLRRAARGGYVWRVVVV
jgi:hypothetical protein